jgi:hypothetical protein
LKSNSRNLKRKVQSLSTYAMEGQANGKRSRSESDVASNVSTKKSKGGEVPPPLISERAMLMAERRAKQEMEKQLLIDLRNQEMKERTQQRLRAKAERKRLQEEERQRIDLEKAAARLIRQQAQKRKREEREAKQKAKQDLIDAEKARKVAAKLAIKAAAAAAKKAEQDRIRSEREQQRIAKQAKIMQDRAQREKDLKKKLEEEDAKRRMRAGLEAEVIAERNTRKKEAQRVKKIQEDARFKREQFQLTYKACYPIEDSLLTTDEDVHPPLPTKLPPRPMPKGRLLGCRSSSWERGALLACYDVLYLFASQMKLLPRFGIHDLHDGLARTDIEIELVTSCVCALLKIILPESVRAKAADDENCAVGSPLLQTASGRHKFVSVGSFSSSSSSSSSSNLSSSDYFDHELFGRHAPDMEAVGPTTYSEILRMVFRRHSAVLTGGGLPRTAKNAIETALLHMDRGYEFYQLDIVSKMGMLTGLVSILKSGKTFKSWIQENLQKASIQKKKANQIILKQRRARAEAKAAERKERKKDREREKRKKMRDTLKEKLDHLSVEERELEESKSKSVSSGDDDDEEEEEEEEVIDNDIVMKDAEDVNTSTSSTSSSSSSSSSSTTATGTNAENPKKSGKKKSRNGPMLIYFYGSTKGYAEIPPPKDIKPVEPGPDENLIDLNTDNNKVTMSRQDTMKVRKLNAEIGVRNEQRAKERVKYEKELKKFHNLENERKLVKKQILEALDYENINDLDKAMKEAVSI